MARQMNQYDIRKRTSHEITLNVNKFIQTNWAS